MREVKEAKDTDASRCVERRNNHSRDQETKPVQWMAENRLTGMLWDKITTNGRESEGDTEVLNEIEETGKSWKPVDQRSDFRSKSWRDWLERAAEEERTC